MRMVLITVVLAVATSIPVPAAEQWIRLSSANFEIYSDAPAKEVRELLTRFERVRSFFIKAAPMRAPEEFPVRIIAFRSRDEYNLYSPGKLSAAFFTANAWRDYIVLSTTSQEAFSLGVHEYTHLVVRHSGLRLPLWLSEGWADVFSSMRNVSDGIAVGDLVKDRVGYLEKGGWMSLDQLTAVNQNSPEYHEASRIGLFYSESWALAHMFYLSPDYRGGFAKFLNAIHRGESFSPAAESAFGKPPGRIFDDLRTYLSRKKLTGQVFEVRVDKGAIKPETTAVSAFDTRLMLADLRAVTGAIERAAEEYAALAVEQPDRPEIALSLGYLALERKDTTTALQQFEKADSAGIQDARMFFQLAALEREAKAPAAKVILLLARAVELQPDFTDALVNLGLIRMEARDYEKALEALSKVEIVIPAAAPAVFTALAYGNLQTGRLEQARGHLATARRYAQAGPPLNAITAMEGLIEARARSKFPPQPGEKLHLLNGMAQSMDCSGASAKLHVLAAGQPMIFELPDPKEVEFSRPHGNTVQLTCTPQQQFPVVVEFAAPNIIRRLEF